MISACGFEQFCRNGESPELKVILDYVAGKESDIGR